MAATLSSALQTQNPQITAIHERVKSKAYHNSQNSITYSRSDSLITALPLVYS